MRPSNGPSKAKQIIAALAVALATTVLTILVAASAAAQQPAPALKVSHSREGGNLPERRDAERSPLAFWETRRPASAARAPSATWRRSTSPPW